MRHVLGLVIPHFNYSEEIKKKLEIDFLVINRTVQDFEKRREAVGVYFAVMNTQMAMEIRQAINSMRDIGYVPIEFFCPDESDFQECMGILNEKTTAMGGIIVLDLSEVAEKDPDKLIRFSKAVGKRCILRQVNRLEFGVEEIEDRFSLPPGVEWDYYGTLGK